MMNTIVNSVTTMRSLTDYEWESNKDQHYSKFSNDSLTTYYL